MGKTWEEIQQEQQEIDEQLETASSDANQELDKWLKPVENQPKPEVNITNKESKSDLSEQIRRERKYLLDSALNNYEEAMQQDEDLAMIYDLAKQYADIQATATYGDYKEETSLSKKIYQMLKDYQDKLDMQAMTEEGDGYSFYERQIVAANLFSYFERLRDGELFVPLRQDGEKGIRRVDGVKHAPTSAFWRRDIKQSVDAPLFAHEPNVNDISQGGLGDCYLLSALSSIVQTHPEVIRQSMYDHGDGKVTVRFFQRDKNDNYTPVYVTVEKVVPSNITGNAAFADDSLWVQTYEAAWAALGMQQSRRDGVFARPVPENIDEIYSDFLERQKKGEKISWDEKKAYPWIFDKKGNLQKWEPSYSAIEGGNSAFVTQCIMGPGYSAAIKKDALSFDDYLEKGSLNMTTLGKMGLISEIRKYWASIHAGEDYSPQKEEQLTSEIMDSASMQVRGTYEIMFFKKAPVDATGSLSMTDPNYMFVYLTQSYLETAMRQLKFKTARELSEFMSREDGTASIADKVKADVEQELKLTLDEVQKKAIKRAVDAHFSVLEQLTEDERQISENPDSARTLDGQYNESDEQLFEKIQKAEQAGIPMTCGTKDKVSDGLVTGHAYSLSGAYKKNVGGKEYIFVKLRNPWGTLTREYDFNNGVLVGHEASGTNGFMELELHDYLNNFNETRFVGPSEKEKATDELESRLQKALSEYKDVTIKNHLVPGKLMQASKTYKLEAVFRKDVGGVTKPFMSLVSAQPGDNSRLECELATYYRDFESPEIGEINLDKKAEAEAAEKLAAEKLEQDKVRAKAAEEKFLKENPENHQNDAALKETAAKQNAEAKARLPYIHALGNLKNCLAKTDGKKLNGSDGYYNMQNALKQMLKQLDSRETVQKALKDASAELGRTAREYLRHCEDVNRRGVRRHERVELAKKLLLVSDMYDINVENPQASLKSVISRGKVDELVAENLQQHPVSTAPEDLRKHIAGMFVDKFAKIAANDPENKGRAEKVRSSKSARETAIKEVLDSTTFKAVYGAKDEKALMKDIKKGEKEIFSKLTKEYDRQKKQQLQLQRKQVSADVEPDLGSK